MRSVTKPDMIARLSIEVEFGSVLERRLVEVGGMQDRQDSLPRRNRDATNGDILHRDTRPRVETGGQEAYKLFERTRDRVWLITKSLLGFRLMDQSVQDSAR